MFYYVCVYIKTDIYIHSLKDIGFLLPCDAYTCRISTKNRTFFAISMIHMLLRECVPAMSQSLNIYVQIGTKILSGNRFLCLRLRVRFPPQAWIFLESDLNLLVANMKVHNKVLISYIC